MKTKEEKEKLIAKIEQIEADSNKLSLDIDSLRFSLVYMPTEKDAEIEPTHEWKVGDCFRFRGMAGNMEFRTIIHGDGKYLFVDPNGTLLGEADDVKYEMRLTYDHAVPITLDEWFAAVRKVHEVNK